MMRKTVKKTAGKKNMTIKKDNAGKKTSTRGTNSKKIMAGGLKKLYLKSGDICKVTFTLPKLAAPEAKSVAIAGDFNDWNSSVTLMKKLKNGDFKATLELPCKREYRFKYLVDDNRWENDWTADKYIPNAFGGDDSVVIV